MRRAIPILAALAISGCLVPGQTKETPRIAGRVVDADSKRPISGATLQFEHHQKQPTVTSRNGSFDIPAMWPVELQLFPFIDQSGGRYLFVTAPGYKPARLTYSRFHTYLHETISLTKLTHLTKR